MVRMVLFVLLLAALLPGAPRPAGAVPLAFGSDLALDPRLTASTALPPVAGFRTRPAGREPIVLPLPGALPHLVVALAGLVLVARRRRSPSALAAPDGAP